MKQKVFIPADFSQYLPDLKQQALRWRMEYRSETDANTFATVENFSLNGDDHINRPNLVLIPGMASNVHTEPLMQSIMYWGLTYKYNVYTMTTFLNEFKPTVSIEDALRHTIPEFITVLRRGINIISEHVGNNWTCLIGHSAGANGILELIMQNQVPTQVSSAIVFAPYISKEWHTTLKGMLHARQHRDLSDKEFNNSAVGLTSPHDIWQQKSVRFVSIMPGFLDELDGMPFHPDLISTRGIPITFVGGGRDRKAPIEHLRSMHEQLATMPNGNLFKFVEFKNSKHSFIDQFRDVSAVIDLIKTQRQKRRNSY